MILGTISVALPTNRYSHKPISGHPDQFMNILKSKWQFWTTFALISWSMAEWPYPEIQIQRVEYFTSHWTRLGEPSNS